MPDSSRRTRAHSSKGSRARLQLDASSGLAASTAVTWLIVRETGEVVHLVDDEQRAMTTDLGEVKLRRGGDGLVGRDVAGKAARGIRLIVGGPYPQGMAEGRPPARVGKGLLGLQAQAVAWHDPDHPLDNVPAAIRVAAAMTGSRLLPPPGVTAARMSCTPLSSLAAIARTSPATLAWWERRGRCCDKLRCCGEIIGQRYRGKPARVNPPARASFVSGMLPKEGVFSCCPGVDAFETLRNETGSVLVWR